MKSRLPIVLSGLLAAAGLSVTATPAQATVPWKILPTGTTDLITAVDYKGSTIAFTTAAGGIYVGSPSGGFTEALDVPGAIFEDVSLSPSGTKGVALAGNDAYVYDGASWAAADWTDVTFDLAAPGPTYPNGYCPAAPAGPGTYPAATLAASADLVDVEWLDEQTAFISVDGVDSSILKTTDGGATWAEAARDSAGNCLVKDKSGPDLTVTGSTVWVMHRTYIGRSVDGFTTVDPYGHGADAEKLAVDPANPLRQIQSEASAHYTHLGLTGDGWDDFDWVRASDATEKINDVVATPGRFYAVGTGGLVERIKASGRLERLRVAGRASTEWRSAAVSGGRLVVAGAGGSMALSTRPAASVKASGARTLPPSKRPPVPGRTAVVRHGKVTFKIRGKLALPPATSRAAGCRGKIRAKVLAAPHKPKRVKVVKRITMKVKGNCRYAANVTIPKPKIGKAKKLRMVLSFSGNPAITKATRKYVVRVRR
ncbi:hypothetical protein BH11ACT8_BH11ACT8_02280 [soil metagenome]